MLRALYARPTLYRTSRIWNSTKAPNNAGNSLEKATELEPIILGSPAPAIERPPPEHGSTVAPVVKDTETPDINSSSVERAANVDPISLGSPAPEAPPVEPGQTAYDVDLMKRRLRAWSEHTAVIARNRADEFTVRSKTRFSQLGVELNKVTGYEAIDALKKQVTNQEERIAASRVAAREAKATYDDAVVQRANSQREVNDLLARKSGWLDRDVKRFTDIVRQDHLYEQEESRAKLAVVETEEAVEREFSELMRTILARYHEEQVWSDKIRSASTYGSLAVLGLNLFIFITAILFVEPWKRKKLAKTFEKKIEEMSAENSAMVKNGMYALGEKLEVQGRIVQALAQAKAIPVMLPPPTNTSMDPIDVAPPVPTPVAPPPPKERTERMKDLLCTPDAQIVVATSAVVAGILGWVIRTLVGA